MLTMLERGAGAAVDRKRNIDSHVDEEYGNYEHKDEDGTLERGMLETLGLLKENDLNVERESDLSVYESIKDEKSSILTKIERLYNVFKSHPVLQDNQLPLLSIESTESHSITIKIQARKLKPESMVKSNTSRFP